MATSTSSFRDRVAGLFQSNPNAWITSDELSSVGGRCAWRTRVSECRKQLGMTIENRVRKIDDYTVSEYKFVPVAEVVQ